MKNRKNNKGIIISITSLFLITLILLGLTYAYYRTRVIGNESTEPSISKETQLLEITYKDGDTFLSEEGEISPGFTASKTFYVENTGDDTTSYLIVLEDIINTYDRTQDWTYVLTENGVEISNGILSNNINQTISDVRTISIPTGTVNTYVLTITYADSEEDQSVDMGKMLSFKVNIKDSEDKWYAAEEGTLIYALRNNQPTGTVISNIMEMSVIDEARIVETEDDYGISYVYRGNVSNNFVTYSNMCWRVLRIQGDGAIKLILADENNPCSSETYLSDNSSMFIDGKTNVAYKTSWLSSSGQNNDDFLFENSDIVNILEDWVKEKNLDTSKLVETNWCNDVARTSISSGWSEAIYEGTGEYWYDYAAFDRLSTDKTGPTLKCNTVGMNGTKSNKYYSNIGLFTADEIVFAGAISSLEELANKNYLSEFSNSLRPDGYLNIMVWTMTPFASSWRGIYAHQYGFDAGLNGYILQINSVSAFIGVLDEGAVRPAITLRGDVTINDLLDTSVYGEVGTHTNPYIVS